jgi:hypothetical protein
MRGRILGFVSRFANLASSSFKGTALRAGISARDVNGEILEMMRIRNHFHPNIVQRKAIQESAPTKIQRASMRSTLTSPSARAQS